MYVGWLIILYIPFFKTVKLWTQITHQRQKRLEFTKFEVVEINVIIINKISTGPKQFQLSAIESYSKYNGLGGFFHQIRTSDL